MPGTRFMNPPVNCCAGAGFPVRSFDSDWGARPELALSRRLLGDAALPAQQRALVGRRVQVRRVPLRRRDLHDVPPPRPADGLHRCAAVTSWPGKLRHLACPCCTMPCGRAPPSYTCELPRKLQSACFCCTGARRMQIICCLVRGSVSSTGAVSCLTHAIRRDLVCQQREQCPHLGLILAQLGHPVPHDLAPPLV